MENYQSSMHTEPTEDHFTKTVEEYTASLPSSGYLAVAVAAMGDLFCFRLPDKESGVTSLLNGFRLGWSLGFTTRW
jgi:hypothetical protein